MIAMYRSNDCYNYILCTVFYTHCLLLPILSRTIRCQVCIGRSASEGVPKWSSGFRMLKKSQVVRLFVKQGQGRPDRFEKMYCTHAGIHVHEHGSVLLLSVCTCTYVLYHVVQCTCTCVPVFVIVTVYIEHV